MATATAHKRLVREYHNLQKSPPDYITAHPDPCNVLEWHYILTGPPGTPYADGQYWGTLNFPADYPFAPPAIRMHTPSARFRRSERLCLSISDFHPKSFNPAWEVGTILLGVLSFMTGEDVTTGSLSASEEERIACAAQSRWWNSTGGGSWDQDKLKQETSGKNSGFGAIKAGDGGKRFREMFPELDQENWKWMKERGVDVATGRGAGKEVAEKENSVVQSGGDGAGTREDGGAAGAIGGGAQAARRQAAGNRTSWLSRNKLYIIGAFLALYVLAARALKDQQER